MPLRNFLPVMRPANPRMLENVVTIFVVVKLLDVDLAWLASIIQSEIVLLTRRQLFPNFQGDVLLQSLL